MQSITNFKALNLRPTIMISHEGLEAIKHIVSIAPQEAQWFHTVEPVQYKQSPGEVFLYLSPRLYIPKQNTSAAQVDSTSSMMIEFYNELKAEYEDQQVVNDKLNSMTCWCHSHHNMNPSPSNQDDTQFNQLVNLSVDQQTNTWQIMLIFNKKNQFYSRVYDPATGIVFEGVDIQVSNAYDFSYINDAAKTKFLKPKPKFKKPYLNKSTSKSSNYDLFSTYSSLGETNYASLLGQNLNLEIAKNIVDDMFSKHYPDSSTYYLKPVVSKSLDVNNLYEELMRNLDDQEALWLSFILDEKLSNIQNLYTDAQVEAYMARYSFKVDERILNYLNTTSDTISCFEDKLSIVFSLTDSPNKKSFVELIKKCGA
jgi:hypothetical protein